MWPFWKSKTARRERVVRFVLDAATLAFGDYLAGRRLARAMLGDPYVLGYVLARLQGSTRYACIDAHLAHETGALTQLALLAFFGGDGTAVLMRAAELGDNDARAGERYRAGAADGTAQCDYLFDVRDVREHARYADAAQRERSAAVAMPGNRYNGTPAAIAHHLEHFTFGEYFARAHPVTAPSDPCSNAA